jgi:hypothetical protein
MKKYQSLKEYQSAYYLKNKDRITKKASIRYYNRNKYIIDAKRIIKLLKFEKRQQQRDIEAKRKVAIAKIFYSQKKYVKKVGKSKVELDTVIYFD